MKKKRISNEQSWCNIFKKYNILDKVVESGYFDITSAAIKSVNNKEPRLMTKIDFEEHLPKIMSQNGLSILAINNGIYRIAKNVPFIPINKIPQVRIQSIKKPDNIKSIDVSNIITESSALDIAHISKMCTRVFEEDTYLTIRGRMRGDLNFNIGNVCYNVNGVQIEVDGGYEGENSINLVEAKLGFNDNINIRQLLYPQLYWEHKVVNKQVNSYIFLYHNELFRFIPYIYDGKLGYADHTNEKAFRLI